MKKFIVIFFLLLAPQLAFAQMEPSRFTFNGSAKDTPKLIENIYTSLLMPGVLTNGLPKYGKTEVIGDPAGEHTVKANVTTSITGADAIVFNDGRFIIFKVWGLNERAVDSQDIVILLKERDENAVKQGLKGIHRNKYIEVDYTYLINNHPGMTKEELTKVKKIITVVRWAIIASGAKQIVE